MSIHHAALPATPDVAFAQLRQTVEGFKTQAGKTLEALKANPPTADHYDRNSGELTVAVRAHAALERTITNLSATYGEAALMDSKTAAAMLGRKGSIAFASENSAKARELTGLLEGIERNASLHLAVTEVCESMSQALAAHGEIKAAIDAVDAKTAAVLCDAVDANTAADLNYLRVREDFLSGKSAGARGTKAIPSAEILQTIDDLTKRGTQALATMKQGGPFLDDQAGALQVATLEADFSDLSTSIAVEISYETAPEVVRRLEAVVGRLESCATVTELLAGGDDVLRQAHETGVVDKERLHGLIERFVHKGSDPLVATVLKTHARLADSEP